MTTYTSDIEKITLENNMYRKVVNTGSKLQLVLMTLKPKEEIGAETHTHVDQFFRIEYGIATAIVNGTTYKLKKDHVLIVHAGSKHNIINRSRTKPLKFYTIYCPPNHTKTCRQTSKKNVSC